MTDVFKFEEATHTYTINGKPATGVTSIIAVLAKPALIGWSARMACEYIDGFVRESGQTIDWGAFISSGDWDKLLGLARTAHTKKKEAAGVHGTDTHALVEQWVNDQINGIVRDIDYKPIAPFIKWANENVSRFLFAERRMFNKELFIAGTADFAYVDKKGRRIVGDFKTSGGVWGIDYFLQVAAYKMLAEAEGDEPYDGMVIVRQGKKGSSDFEVQYLYDYTTYKNAFLACLTLYRAQANIKDVIIKEV